jgi:hypothetical protein
MVLRVNASGDVVLPAELIQAAPDSPLEAERQGDAIILRPPDARGAKSARRSILDLPTIHTRPVDASMTFRRGDIYGDDGR